MFPGDFALNWSSSVIYDFELISWVLAACHFFGRIADGWLIYRRHVDAFFLEWAHPEQVL